MNDTEKAEIAWVTARLAEIQHYEKSTLGGALLFAVERHLREKFPQLMGEFQAAVTETRKARADQVTIIMATEGPKLWRILHSHARISVSDKSAEEQWLAQFQRTLPCGTCRDFTRKFITENPPDFRSYFEWTVKFHNAVNVKLGKPTLTVADAEKLYT